MTVCLYDGNRLTSVPTFPTFPYFLIQSPTFPYFLRKQPYYPYFLGFHVVIINEERLKRLFKLIFYIKSIFVDKKPLTASNNVYFSTF